MGNVGERKITSILSTILHTRPEDAQWLEIVAGRKQSIKVVANADTFVESTDAPPGMPYYYYGWKVAVMSASDLIAKGIEPLFALLSVVVPADIPLTALISIIEGFLEACVEHDIRYLGGDLNEGREVVLTGVAIGIGDRIIPRGGVQPGDYIWTTGMYGYTGAALDYLLRGGKPTSGMGDILKAFLKPRIRVDVLPLLRMHAVASTDSSDGLAASLWNLAESSGVRIEVQNIPTPSSVVEYARANRLKVADLALYGGEEYEIVFATRGRIVGRGIYYVGRAREGEGVFFRGREVGRGYEHFWRQE